MRPLDRLCTLHGILPAHERVRGGIAEAPDSTRRALLEAMGVAADDASLEASLHAALGEPWRRPLPPVIVQHADEPVPVRLPAGARGTLRWRVLREDGGVHEGEAAVARLRETDRAEVDGTVHRELALPLGVDLPQGYHRLEVADSVTTLIRAPERCFGVEEAVGPGRVFGVSCQVHALRSARDHGIGDLEDLARLGERMAGADLLGVNPLHALFPADPAHIGPYSPSSRAFVNVATIAIDRVEELADCPEAQALLPAPASGDLIDYRESLGRKLRALEILYDGFPREGARADAFRSFVEAEGGPLSRHATFDALHEHMLARDPPRWAWWDWPAPLQDPDGDAVAAFAREHEERVTFHAWLQWIADEQLRDTQARLKAAGMRIGLYRDLAVGLNPAGADVWGERRAMLRGVAAGAPPDAFNPAGQNWGLVPFSPRGLRELAYGPFVEVLRRNMRHTGALRIDHVMALKRLFLLPEGRSGIDGAYVLYPFEDLLRIVALESHRQRCVVIGEDLGTVPEGFRDSLARHGLLSYRLFYFERHEDGSLVPPGAWPEEALAAVSTHDLPTLRGYWTGNDLAWRERIAGRPDPEAHGERIADRRVLLRALEREGLLPVGLDPEHPPDAVGEALLVAVHRFVARTPCRIAILQIEDALMELEQVNLPGTLDEHPNWRRRLGTPVERLLEVPSVRAVLEAMAKERS
jgi:4-alpha-glucanotransferase